MADASKQDVAVAGARMAEAQASLDRATTDLSYTAVRSPIAGTVARKHMEEGEMAAPTEPIYTVASTQGVWVSAEIDEIDAAAVAVDQQVAITLDAYPGTKVMGRVVRVSPIAEPKEVGRVRAKVLRAKVVLEPHDIPLKPGMEVNVTGSVSASKEALLVPNDAVMRVGGKDKVFVVRGDTAVETQVEVGQSSYDYTQIKSGLKKGDHVATSGLGELSDGARVRVSE